MTIEQKIASGVRVFNSMFPVIYGLLVISFIAGLVMSDIGRSLLILVLIPLLFPLWYALHYLGLRILLLGYGLYAYKHRDQLATEMQQKELRRLNQELAEGKIVNDADLQKRLEAASISYVTLDEFGPVIGTHHDEPIYEFVKATDSVQQITRTYTYAGPATYTADGDLISNNNTLSVMVQGSLYEFNVS